MHGMRMLRLHVQFWVVPVSEPFQLIIHLVNKLFETKHDRSGHQSIQRHIQFSVGIHCLSK